MSGATHKQSDADSDIHSTNDTDLEMSAVNNCMCETSTTRAVYDDFVRRVNDYVGVAVMTQISCIHNYAVQGAAIRYLENVRDFAQGFHGKFHHHV